MDISTFHKKAEKILDNRAKSYKDSNLFIDRLNRTFAPLLESCNGKVSPQLLMLYEVIKKILRMTTDPKNEDHYIDASNYLFLAYKKILEEDDNK